MICIIMQILFNGRHIPYRKAIKYYNDPNKCYSKLGITPQEYKSFVDRLLEVIESIHNQEKRQEPTYQQPRPHPQPQPQPQPQQENLPAWEAQFSGNTGDKSIGVPKNPGIGGLGDDGTTLLQQFGQPLITPAEQRQIEIMQAQQNTQSSKQNGSGQMPQYSPNMQQPQYPPNFQQPQYSPNVQPQYSPNVQPQYPPNVQPQYSPNVQPQYSPNVQPQYSPNVQPQYSPNVQPQYPPNVQPQYPPNVQPQYPPNVQPQYPPNVQPQYSPNVQPQMSQFKDANTRLAERRFFHPSMISQQAQMEQPNNQPVTNMRGVDRCMISSRGLSKQNVQ
jgi:hypothetical protein